MEGDDSENEHGERGGAEEVARYFERVVDKALSDVKHAGSTNAYLRQLIRQGFNKLMPVRKDIRVGKRGKLFYINARGKETWLNEKQRSACHAGTLPFASNCPPSS